MFFFCTSSILKAYWLNFYLLTLSYFSRSTCMSSFLATSFLLYLQQILDVAEGRTGIHSGFSSRISFINFYMVSHGSSFVEAMFHFNLICPSASCGQQERFFNSWPSCMFNLLLVFVLGDSNTHYYTTTLLFFNIVGYSIFCCIATYIKLHVYIHKALCLPLVLTSASCLQLTRTVSVPGYIIV